MKSEYEVRVNTQSMDYVFTRAICSQMNRRNKI